MNQLYRLVELNIKEYIRDPAAFFWGLGFPILMIWGLGITFTSPNKPRIEIAVVSTVSNSDLQIIKELTKKSERVTFVVNEYTRDVAEKFLKRGEIGLILNKSADKWVYLFDTRNSESKLSYHELKDVLEERDSATSEILPIEVLGTRYVDFLIPGFVGMGIMMSCMWGTSYLLIDRRNKKLLRRLVATPMNRPLFLFAQIISRHIVSLMEISMLLLFSYFAFDFRPNVSVFALWPILFAGHCAFSGLAILLASRTASVDIGNGLINAITTPCLVLSGVFFSIRHFPEWARPVIDLLPLTVLLKGLRHLMLEGGSWFTFAPELYLSFGVMMVFGTICFLIGLKIYKWY